MKAFKDYLLEMKEISRMSDREIEKWLDKTSTTINNFKRGRPLINNTRAYDLVDRYNDLRDEAISRGIWKPWCDKNGSCPTHIASDLWS